MPEEIEFAQAIVESMKTSVAESRAAHDVISAGQEKGRAAAAQHRADVFELAQVKYLDSCPVDPCVPGAVWDCQGPFALAFAGRIRRTPEGGEIQKRSASDDMPGEPVYGELTRRPDGSWRWLLTVAHTNVAEGVVLGPKPLEAAAMCGAGLAGWIANAAKEGWFSG